MTPLFAIGLSVLLHVFWNLLTRRTSTEANFLWWIVGLYVLVFALFTLPDFIHAAQQSPVLYICAAISGTTNGLYFLALKKAYVLAPASAVYWQKARAYSGRQWSTSPHFPWVHYC